MTEDRLQSLAALALMLGAITQGTAIAGNSATQQVRIEVQPIDELALSGARPTLTIDTASAGSAPVAVEADGGTYAITTNGSQRKITASLAAELPPGVSLALLMAAPAASGTSAGWRTLSPTPTEVVTGISRTAQAGIGLRYRLVANVDGGTVSARTETVTITLADDR
jgi:hypothetical protein